MQQDLVCTTYNYETNRKSNFNNYAENQMYTMLLLKVISYSWPNSDIMLITKSACTARLTFNLIM